MHFIDFIKTAPKQLDKHILSVVELIINDKNFPKTGDPAKLAIHLYLKLDEKQTTAFQQLLMIYRRVPNNKLPKRAIAREDMFLDALNLIVNLQNCDSDYKHY